MMPPTPATRLPSISSPLLLPPCPVLPQQTQIQLLDLNTWEDAATATTTSPAKHCNVKLMPQDRGALAITQQWWLPCCHGQPATAAVSGVGAHPVVLTAPQAVLVDSLGA